MALAPWRERVRAEAAEHGFGRDDLAVLTRQTERRSMRPVDLEQIGAFLAGPAGLTAQRNTFDDRHVVVELAAAHPDGARVADLEQASRAFLRRCDVVRIATPAPDRRYTMASLLACERRTVSDAVHGQGTGMAVVKRDLANQALAGLPMRLNDEQVAAVRAIAASGNTVDVVEALAGTGKTTVAGALAAVYLGAGYQVRGAAPTGRAARELSSRAGVPASTLHGLIEDLRRSDGFGSDPVVLLIDEAGMAPTRVSADVLAGAHRDGVKVVALGDSGQLSSVEAGGWLGALSQRLGAHELRAVVRQRDPAERDALAELHGGEPDRWLVLKRARGELVVHDGGPQAAQGAAMAAWRADVVEVGTEQAIMIVRDNQARAALNDQARAWRDAQGELGERIEVGGLEVAVGDRVMARRNDRELDVDNGTRGTVRAVDLDTHAVTIETDADHVRQLPADYVAEHLEYAYALTGHGSQGATVGRTVVVGRPEDFTNEWAYTALSRARDPVHVHLIAERDDRSDRSEIAPSPPERTSEDAIDAMRAAMGRREREELAIDHAASLGRASVPGEAGAEANERAQRQQLALDLDHDSAVTEPVPEVLRAVRGPAPLWAIEHRIGMDAHAREAIEQARQTLGAVSREALADQAERLDDLAMTFPHLRVEARQRADQLSRLQDEQREAHESIAFASPRCASMRRGRPPRPRRRSSRTGWRDLLGAPVGLATRRIAARADDPLRDSADKDVQPAESRESARVHHPGRSRRSVPRGTGALSDVKQRTGRQEHGPQESRRHTTRAHERDRTRDDSRASRARAAHGRGSRSAARHRRRLGLGAGSQGPDPAHQARPLPPVPTPGHPGVARGDRDLRGRREAPSLISRAGLWPILTTCPSGRTAPARSSCGPTAVAGRCGMASGERMGGSSSASSVKARAGHPKRPDTRPPRLSASCVVASKAKSRVFHATDGSPLDQAGDRFIQHLESPQAQALEVDPCAMAWGSVASLKPTAAREPANDRNLSRNLSQAHHI